METKKIAIACFVGGFICVAVALAVNPIFWWMGMFAGFVAGYLSYEFRSVLYAMPVAWKKAKRGGNVVGQKIKNSFKWFFRKHPVWHPFAIVFFLFFVFFVIVILSLKLPINITPAIDLPQNSLVSVFVTILGVFILFGMILYIAYAITEILLIFVFCVLIEIGAKNENCKVDFYEECFLDETGKSNTLNYSDLSHWWIKGLFMVINMAVKGSIYFPAIVIEIAIKLWQMFCFFCRFLKKFFVLIHSNKRLLCGIDSSISGTVAYIWLISPSMDVWSKIILCIFGGLIGVGFGILNHEIIIKRTRLLTK